MSSFSFLLKFAAVLFGHALSELFFFPARFLRYGFRAFPITGSSLKSHVLLSWWKMGSPKARLIKAGRYTLPLADGRPLRVAVYLLGGKDKIAFLEVSLAGDEPLILGTFFFPHSTTGSGAPVEQVLLGDDVVTPGDRMIDTCVPRLPRTDQALANQFLNNISGLLG